jgi:biotin synthase
VDSSLLLQSVGEAEVLFAAGLCHVGFGLDAASERVFTEVKGGSWGRIWSMIEATARDFPGRVAVHLIVGLGESEQEMLSTIQDLHDLGAIVALFAFTPVQGTRLANQSPPSLRSYRRIQSARWLIVHNAARATDFSYDSDGQLRSLSRSGWQQLLSEGEAFQTSGCPDCNRPFYNERPGGAMYNYPRQLTPEEARIALNECVSGW